MRYRKWATKVRSFFILYIKYQAPPHQIELEYLNLVLALEKERKTEYPVKNPLKQGQ